MYWASVVCVAVVALVASCSAVLPEQIRLALTAGSTSSTAMTAVFATSNLTEPGYVPLVQWGLGSIEYTSGCDSYNYTHEPAFQKSVHTHVCNMTSLIPNTEYVYRVGSTTDGFSEEFYFTSPPEPGQGNISVVMYGDMGISFSEPTAQRVASIVQQHKAQLIVHCGDISYADDRADINNGTIYEGVWDDFLNEIQPYSSLVPYMFSPGNHESIYDFIVYQKRISTSMPSVSSGSDSPFWYSYDYGMIHFIAFSIEQNYSIDSPQGQWLLNDLQQAGSAENRTIRPWIVAYAHRPMWCSNTFWCPDAGDFKLYWQDLFNEYVDIYIAGHVHVYERIWPVSPNGTVLAHDYLNMETTLHICTGSPGNIELPIDPWEVPTPAWSALRYEPVMLPQYLGVSNLHVYNATNAYFEFINSHSGQVIDAFPISRVRKY